ncbi:MULTISPECIES: DUF2062 domain-containing protein [unclassified Nitrospina]|uniref:DUF2062 domain-containing protein n=1 Tax=unclassified Nitrospina TaxID=2638683 RepID=UPI003F9525D5
MKITSVFRKKIYFPLVHLLKQGLSPSKLALVFALGMTLSVFPVLGTTTFLCTLVALWFRLNLPAIQLANYMAFPFQIILFFPFLNIGEQISGRTLHGISESTLISAFSTDFFQAIVEFSQYLVLACLGWALASIPFFFIIFYLFRIIFTRYEKNFSSGKIFP